ncbi:MAG: hypothetical protein ACRD0G_05620 [Acidimicrobiales bacterium]
MTDRPMPPPHPFERDRFVAGALRSMEIPDHRPGFWTELDARLAVVDAERAGSTTDERADEETESEPVAERDSATVVVPTVGDAVPTRLDTGELPMVTPLPIESRRERRARQRGRFLAAAAVLVIVAVGTALFLNRPDDRPVQPAVTSGTSTTASPTTTAPTTEPPDVTPTTTAEPNPPAVGRAVDAVMRFVQTVGRDNEAAFGMLTQESRDFLGSPDQFATGYSEGLGAWAAPDAIESTIPMPVDDMHAVVALTGTVNIEGTPEPRTQAFAMVLEEGAWRFSITGSFPSASAGPAIEMINPDVTPQFECCGIGTGVAQGDPIQFAVPPGAEIDGITVQLDDDSTIPAEELDLDDTVVTAQLELSTGTHVVTIAVVLPSGSFYARAVQFAVE